MKIYKPFSRPLEELFTAEYTPKMTMTLYKDSKTFRRMNMVMSLRSFHS